MEFVNNAAFLVFIVFLTDSETEEETVVAFHSRQCGQNKKNPTSCVFAFSHHAGVEELEAEPDLASDRTLVFCAVLCHRSFPPHH